jgi:hypothetical protein
MLEDWHGHSLRNSIAVEASLGNENATEKDARNLRWRAAFPVERLVQKRRALGDGHDIRR